MHPAIREACAYLAARGDYLVWAGFAGWVLAGIPTSPDLDLYLARAEAAGEAADDLARLGWEMAGERGGPESFVLTLTRDGATVDLCYAAAAAMLFPDRQARAVEGYELLFISAEGLYLTKLGQALAPGRDPAKQARDLAVLAALRARIDPARLKRLLAGTTEAFWREGYL